MTYQHDVFISYKREELWTPWARDHFQRLLRSYLQQDLGEPPDIFIDERIEVGADWVDSLAYHLATSKSFIAIFSADYFASDWCIHELDLMLERSLTVMRPGNMGLIVPVVVHDGDLIPEPVNRLQRADLHKFRIACINETTPDYHEFSKAVRDLAPIVAAAVNLAPNYDPAWLTQSTQRFNRVFQASRGGPKVDPGTFVVRRPSPLTRLPRLLP